MARHAPTLDRRTRRVRRGLVTVVWLAGLAAGFYAALSIGVRYGCGRSNDAIACHNGGTALGGLLLIAVIAIVTTVTVAAGGRAPKHVAVLTVSGLVALALCLVAAVVLLRTV